MVKPPKTVIYIYASGSHIFYSINLKFCVKALLKEICFLFARHVAVNGGNGGVKDDSILMGKKYDSILTGKKYFVH